MLSALFLILSFYVFPESGPKTPAFTCSRPHSDTLVLQRHFVTLGVAVPDVERPPLDDRQLCGLNDHAVAAGHSVDPDRWQRGFDELMLTIGARFGRVEPRRRARAFMQGLLAGLPRVNCWTIAEHAGERIPGECSGFWRSAVVDADGLRDDLRSYVVEHLGDPAAVLIVDETGDVKKGTMTAGVQRQYTGTAGRIENAQVAVYLAYASERGYAFIDRALYLPRSWTDDPGRCQASGRARGRGVRDQASAGPGDDHPRGRRRDARAVGGR